MQRNQQTKTATWSTFPSTLPYQKPFSKEKNGLKATVFSKKRVLSRVFSSNQNLWLKKKLTLTNKFINLIMTDGEKEKAFKNLQTTLYHLNQKRIGKGKPVLDPSPFKGEEKRKSGSKQLVSSLPFSLHSVVPPLQLPTESLKNSVFQKSFSFFSSKKKVSSLSNLSQHYIIEVKCSLLSSVETTLESSLNQRKDREKVTKKEKGWCLCSKEEKKTKITSEKKFKNPFLFEKPCSLKSSIFSQNSFSKGEKEKSLTFATLLGESTLFLQQQNLPSIQEVGKRSFFFFNPQTLSFKDLSMLGESVVSFSPFLKERSQKEKKKSDQPFSVPPFPLKNLEKEVLSQDRRKVKECFYSKEEPLPASWSGFSKCFFLLESEKKTFFTLLVKSILVKKNEPKEYEYENPLFCRPTLSSLFPLWVCFKRGKNRKTLCFQRENSSIETKLWTQKQTTFTPPKERQRTSLSGDGVKKVTKRNQKPKDNLILTTPKADKTEENTHPFHMRVLYKGVSQVRPLIEVRKVRKGGNTFQVPAFVKKRKGEKMGLTWLIEKGREKSRKSTLSFSESLCSNLLQSFEKSGEARQKRDQLLRLALSNRPYSRFRWW